MRRTAAVAALALLAWAALRATRPVAPAFDSVRAAHGPTDARLLDRHGEVLDARRIDPVRRRLAWVPLAAVSPALPAAVVAAEDRRFARHGGVDARAIVAAGIQAIRGGRRRGASTLTMQVAALVDPALRAGSGGRTLGQKWRQMRAARALERLWTKEQILEAYLNLVDVRGALSGVGAAAAGLFRTTPARLDAAESAVFAALLAAPAARPAAVVRRATAWREALQAPPPAAAIASAARRGLTRPGLPPAPGLAPHLADRLGATPGDTITTLDAAIQRAAIGVLRRTLLAIRDRGVRDGAVLVADTASGDVLAYVGSGGALASAPWVDGVRARRQAGSTLKPFLYGLALERRLVTPASLVEDAPLELPSARGIYRPENYDHRFRGLVSVRTALAASLNTPAVRTLGLVGGEAFVARLRRFGFDGVTQQATFYGPSLALGSADVSLWELVGAYRALATGGRWTSLRLAPGDIAEAPRAVLTPAAAFLVADVLADRAARSPTFGLENPLATPFWTAVKTGTSTDMRDNWCVGFSGRYTVGVWVGNFSGAPMHDVSGVTGAAPAWLELMEHLHREFPSEPPSPPSDVRAVPVVFPNAVEPPRTEWTLAGTAPGASTLAVAPPRIRSPADGSRIALDPDVPSARQRMRFDAAGATAPLRFRLDGRDVGPAATPQVWAPAPGSHALELVDASGAVHDAVAFTVRGGPPTPDG